MAIEQKQVEIAKEVDDVLELLVAIVRDLKAKKDTNALLSDNLPKLLDAITGVDQLDDELKQNRPQVMNAAGLRIAELVEVLLG